MTTTTAASVAPAPSSTAAGATTASTAADAPTALTLRVTDVRLINSEESDNAARLLLPAGVATASVTLTGVPTPNRVVSVCQARDLDARMVTAVCRTPANGDAVTLTLGSQASGVEIVQVGVASAGPQGSSLALDDVTVRYSATSREVKVRLPQIAGAGAGGLPTFSLSPASADGAYRAALRWTVIPAFGGTPSAGRLEVVQGANVSRQSEGTGSPVELNGNLTPPVGEAAIRATNPGQSALVAPKLDLVLP